MRKKHLFWMLQIIMVLLLSISVANAQHLQDVEPQVDDQNLLIDEDEDTVNDAIVCIECELGKYESTRIFYSNCTKKPYTVDQKTSDKTVGIWNAFDRDIAFQFSGGVATPDASWYETADTDFSGKSHVGFCTNSTDNYLFAICNCVLKNYFLPTYKYVFEVKVIGEGVYWTDRNLSLFYDSSSAYDASPLSPDLDYLGGEPYGDYDDNVIRFVVGKSEDFFCDGTWIADINDVSGWEIDTAGDDYDWYLGYAAVKDYITRNYKSDFDQSTCAPDQKPFHLLDEDLEPNGVIYCNDYNPVTTTRWNNVNAKILRTYPVQLFPPDFPALSQTPYLYLDLPTMIYRPGEGSDYAELCESVSVMITLASPFAGVCSTCCNLPMCSCEHEVGTFGCDPDECDDPGQQEEDFAYKCVPYLTYLVDDWWDALAIANMSASSIAPVITFYANGMEAKYEMPAIAAHSVEAFGLEGDVSDDIHAAYPDFPLSGHAMYAEVAVEGTDQFDVFALIYNPSFGTTSMLARCSECGTCTSCR